MNVWIFIVFRYWLKTLDPDGGSGTAEHRPGRGSKPMREGREERRRRAAAPPAEERAVRRALRAEPAHEPGRDTPPPTTAAAAQRHSAQTCRLRTRRPYKGRFGWSGRPGSRGPRAPRRTPRRSGVRRSTSKQAHRRPGRSPSASPSSPRSGTRAQGRRERPSSRYRRRAEAALCIVSFSPVYVFRHASTMPHSARRSTQFCASRRAVASSTP